MSKDHFGHALTKGTVVIDLGEAEILEGQMAQALDGLVGRKTLVSDLLEKLAKSY
ncbi:MAG: hypothetical protein WBW53_22395 [Terriglobales bacterium]